MKKLVIIFFALLAFSCDKEKNEPIKGSLSCKINGTEWTGNPFGSMRKDQFGVSFTKTRKIGDVNVRWQFLSFDGLKKTNDYQQVYKIDYFINEQDSAFSNFNTTQDDGDVACDTYDVIEADSLTNYIRITREEGNYKEVWGEFSVNFVRTRGCSESTLPDTLRIREGKFHVVLE